MKKNEFSVSPGKRGQTQNPNSDKCQESPHVKEGYTGKKDRRRGHRCVRKPDRSNSRGYGGQSTCKKKNQSSNTHTLGRGNIGLGELKHN